MDQLNILAFQISSFLSSSGTAFERDVPEEIRYTIRYIVSHYPWADQEQSSLEGLGEVRSTRRSQSVEPPRFPYGWATDRPTFRRAVKKFISATDGYGQLPEVADYIQKQRELAGDPGPLPGDTGTGPSDSGRVTQSLSPTAADTDRRPSNTTNTSAEEVIYDRPIGPTGPKGKNKATMSDEPAITPAM